MRLEEIGFYTMSNYRTRQLSYTSPLWRCELILTDKCNFRCPYCRGVKKKFEGEKTYHEAKNIVDLWIKEGLKNIRFSGGEPTTWKDLLKLVSYSKENGVERIAISSNGSADFSYYEELIMAGVNDFSISLDACCSSFGDKMAGVKGVWNKELII